jgi:hypothetical protein
MTYQSYIGWLRLRCGVVAAVVVAVAIAVVTVGIKVRLQLDGVVQDYTRIGKRVPLGRNQESGIRSQESEVRNGSNSIIPDF